MWSSWFYSIPTHCNQTEARRNNSLVPSAVNVSITVIGNREHYQDGDNMIKVDSGIWRMQTQTCVRWVTCGRQWASSFAVIDIDMYTTSISVWNTFCLIYSPLWLLWVMGTLDEWITSVGRNTHLRGWYLKVISRSNRWGNFSLNFVLLGFNVSFSLTNPTVWSCK